VLGALNERQHRAPRRPPSLLLARLSLPPKNVSRVRLVVTQLSSFVLKKRRKRKECIVPWVAPERKAFLHMCRDAHRSAF
jgi:hypothetical protein